MHPIAVVIPCYKVKSHIAALLTQIGKEVVSIYVIDDCCPEGTGKYVESLNNERVKVLYHKENKGVGGAVMTGYQAAIADGAAVIVKLDGDGQMDPRLISKFVDPILHNKADYTKGNRFYDIDSLRAMPKVRLFGNTALSFLTKLSSGYWNLFDPTNGYTAINASVAASLPLSKISERYFFESDILFRLNTFKAVVIDIPMYSVYQDETSSLSPGKQIVPFLTYNLRNTFKRFIYNYLFRNFNFASIEFLIGILLFSFGTIFGIWNWIENFKMNTFASSGTVMLSALPVILGFQLLLGFINYDMSTLPVLPLGRVLTRPSEKKESAVF